MDDSLQNGGATKREEKNPAQDGPEADQVVENLLFGFLKALVEEQKG